MRETTQGQLDLPPCVLVTAGDAWGSILGMARSIGRHGVPVYVAAFGYSPHVMRWSRYCRGASLLPREEDLGAMAERLVGWWSRTNEPARPVLVPMSDHVCTCVAEHRDLLEQAFNICSPSSEVMLGLLDKRRAHALAAESGLEVPRSWFAASRGELQQVAGQASFPVMVKPIWWRLRGRTDFKAVRYSTREELLARGAEAVRAGAALAVQQYVPGGDETVEVYMFYRSRDGGTIYDCTGLKIRQFPPGAGIMASGRTIRLPHVAEMSRAFLERIDYRGLGGIEYKRYGGRSYFIEMSVRPEGFHPLSIQAGVDLPWYAYCDLALGRLPAAPTCQKEAYWLDGRAYVGLLRYHLHEVPTIREAAKLLLRPRTVKAMWSWVDPMPWIVWMGQVTIAVFRKIVQVFFTPRYRLVSRPESAVRTGGGEAPAIHLADGQGSVEPETSGGVGTAGVETMQRQARELSDAQAGPWDAFVRSHPFGRAFASTAGRAWWRVNGWSLHPIGLLEGDAITGGAALVTKRLPLTSWTVARVEALLADPRDVAGSAAALLEAAERVARKNRALELEVRVFIPQGVAVRDIQFGQGVLEALGMRRYERCQTQRASYLVKIDVDDEQLLRSFTGKCRRDVRKGLREGTTVVELRSPEDVRMFFHEHAQMSIRKHLPPLNEPSRQALQMLCEQGCFRLFAAQYQGRTRNMAFIDALGIPRYFLGTTTPGAMEKGVPPTGQALHYGIMRWFRDRGVQYYDLGGSPGPVPQEGHPNYTVWRFKYEFGAPFVHMVAYHRKPLTVAGGVIMNLARLLRGPEASEGRTLPRPIRGPRVDLVRPGGAEPTRQDIRIVSEADRDAWNAFVLSHPFGRAALTTLGRRSWSVDGWTLRLIGMFRDGAVRGGVAMVTKKVPHTPWTIARVEALLMDPRDVVGSAGALLEAAEGVARSESALEIEARLAIPEDLAVDEADYKTGGLESLRKLRFKAGDTRRGTYMMKIDVDDEELLNTFNSKARWETRKGLRKGVTVVQLRSREDLWMFCREHAQMCVKKGLRPLRESDQQALLPLFERGYLKLFVAQHEGKPCNMAVIDAGGIPKYYLGSTTLGAFEKGVPPTGKPLHFCIMQWFRERGVRFYDLGGSPGPVPQEEHPNYTVWRFKYEFGAPYVYMIPYHRKALSLVGRVVMSLVRRTGRLEP